MAERLTGEALLSRLAARPEGGRQVVAIAGAPGSGKSTFCDGLCGGLNAARPGSAAIVPMDGFHYDDRVLVARGHRARKGAPHTFDVEGLAATLARLRAETAVEVAVPVFDRALEIARAGARIIEPQVETILVEGNYLLLDDSRWATLRPFFDLTVMLAVPLPVIEARLEARWRALTGEAFREKMEGNDLPNARLVIERSVAPDIVVTNG